MCLALTLGLLIGAAADPAPGPGPIVHRAPKPLAPNAVTSDWPAFLGPTHDGVCTETRLLKQWPATGPPLVWELAKGTGYSSPSVAGHRVILFHRLEDREIVVCLEAETGKLQWQFGYRSNYRDRYGYNNGPRATPVIDADRVFTIGAEARVHGLALASGQIIWQRDLAAEYKLEQGFFGFTSTPLVYEDLLIINVGAPGGPCVVALNKMTGRTVWESGDRWGSSYASPVVAMLRAKPRLLVFAGGRSRPPTGGLLCIDPIDGRIDFRFPWRSTSFESVNAACPVVAGDRVFISASYQIGGALIGVDRQMQPETLWMTDQLGTHFGTAIHRDGYLYGFDGRNPPDAALVCLDIETGRPMWRYRPQWQEQYEAYGRRQSGPFSTYRGNLVWADGHYLCLGELGHLLWLDLTPKHQSILARTWLFAAPQTWCPPVISRGLLYVVQNDRDMRHGQKPRLLCYDLRAPA